MLINNLYYLDSFKVNKEDAKLINQTYNEDLIWQGLFVIVQVTSRQSYLLHIG